VQTWVRTLKLLGTRSPQPLQSWLVWWAGTATTRRPAPSPCCLGVEDGAKLRPAGIADALGQVTIPRQVGNPQVFQIDRIVVSEQRQCRLVVEVLPPALHCLVRPLEMAHGLRVRWVPFFRRLTRRCAFASFFSARR